MLNRHLLETDQTECYDERGNKTGCSGTGQEAEGKPTRDYPKPRFKVEDDTVKDSFTGLCWSRDANLFDFPLSWGEGQAAIGAMNAEKQFDRDNWRLPSRSELFSIVSHQHRDPCLPEGHPFLNVFSGYYWTATACARLPDQAWYIHLGGGRIYRGSKESSCMVWPVCWMEPRVDEMSVTPRWVAGDLTVLDRATGLMWIENGDLAGEPVSWQSALNKVKALNLQRTAGHTDWRLPNIRELESLTDTGLHSPALPKGHPFNTVREGYWSATTSVYEPRYAWVLYTRDGAVGVGFKVLAEFGMWAVRRCIRQENLKKSKDAK